MFKKLGLAILSLLVVSSLAVAAGFWQGLPVVGDLLGTTCISFANPTSAQPCNQFSPIGPAQVPPTAKIPADTGNTATGPFTVLIPAVMTGSTVQDAAPLTGATVTLVPGTANLALDPAATIAALTVALPAASTLIDGQSLVISTSQTVTALTVTAGSGTTVVPTITTVTASAAVVLTYHAATAKWVAG